MNAIGGVKLRVKTRPHRTEINPEAPRLKALQNLPIRITAGFLEAELIRLGLYRSDNPRKVNVDATAALLGVARTTVRRWLTQQTMIPERILFTLQEYGFEIRTKFLGEHITVEAAQFLHKEHAERIDHYIDSQDIRRLRDEYDRGASANALRKSEPNMQGALTDEE